MQLRVAGTTVWPWSKVLIKEIKGRNVTKLDGKSFLGKIMTTLSHKLEFNYTFILTTSWGTKDLTAKSLKFNGMAGMLQNDQIDLALGPFEIDRGDRYLIADPSAIIIKDAYAILSSGESVISKSIFDVSSLTKSFQTNVWYLILSTLLLIILIISFNNYILAKKSNKIKLFNKKSFTEILIRNGLEYSGNLMGKYSRSHQPPQIFKLCWNLPSFLLVLFYSSMILVYLIASNKKYIETFDDLANADVMTTTYINSTIELQIREGKTEAINRIYSQMIKHGLNNCLIPSTPVPPEEIVVDIISGKRAFIALINGFKTFLSFRAKLKGRCGFHLTESLVDYVPLFMLYNKKFNKKMKEKIDFILLELFERKPFDWKLGRLYSRYQECLHDPINSHWKPLILLNIRGLLLVCVIIITLAFIIFFLELMKKSPLNERRR